MDSRLKRALVGLATSTAAPSNVLVRLVPLPEAANRMAWRQRAVPDMLAEKLLATKSPTIALALDTVGRCSPTFRERIAEHPDGHIRDARRRFVEHTISVGNRVLIDELERYAGPDGLAGLAGHPDPWLREAVARTWANMPVATRRALLIDPDAGVRRAAAGYPHPPAPEDLHARLLLDDATRTAAASYAVLSPQTALELVVGDEEVRSEVVRNPSLPPELRDRLADDPSPVVRALVVLRQDLHEARRQRLYQDLITESDGEFNDADIALMMIDAAWMDHVMLGWLRSLPLHHRLAYLDSPVAGLRRTVADSRDLPPDIAARLDSDADVTVRRIVARRADVPPAVLERLVRDHGENRKVTPLLVEHVNFPRAGFIRLATNPDPTRRALALRGKDLPASIVAALASDEYASVRRAAAGHPGIPVDRLEALLGDDDLDVVEAAGAAPALPATVMIRLLQEAGL